MRWHLVFPKSRGIEIELDSSIKYSILRNHIIPIWSWLFPFCGSFLHNFPSIFFPMGYFVLSPISTMPWLLRPSPWLGDISCLGLLPSSINTFDPNILGPISFICLVFPKGSSFICYKWIWWSFLKWLEMRKVKEEGTTRYIWSVKFFQGGYKKNV